MSRLRTLRAVRDTAHTKGLNPVTTMQGDVVIDCPLCREAGTYSRAVFRSDRRLLAANCHGCERYDDDPLDVLRWLGHDPDEGEPHEIALRVFDLLWAMHKLGVAA